MNSETISFINTVLAIAALAGGLIAFVRSRKAETVRMQDETITVLQQQINAIKGRQDMLEKENYHLKQIIETIQSALRQRGIHVTIDGEMVIIEDATVHPTRQKRVTKIPNKPNI